MKIAIDGGALCGRGYGTALFAENLISSVYKYDKKNDYRIYSFCDIHLGGVEKKFTIRKLPSPVFMKGMVSTAEFVSPSDVFLGLNQALPYAHARKIAFSHGLSFHFFPHLYKESYQRLAAQLEDMVTRADVIVTSSERVTEELQHLYPTSSKIVTLPFGISEDYMSTRGRHKLEHITQEGKQYFMFCGMNHPIKNVDFILRAFKKFRSIKKYSHFNLFLVGDYFDVHQENVYPMEHTSTHSLRDLYANSEAYLTASHYESFNLPVLEALTQDCPVVGMRPAIIPELNSFVSVADTEDEFVEKMVNVVEKRPKVNRKVLFDTFSWEKYVKTLKKLY
jgi:glycosyltransferase involved in cell wall biosynthesis